MRQILFFTVLIFFVLAGWQRCRGQRDRQLLRTGYSLAPVGVGCVSNPNNTPLKPISRMSPLRLQIPIRLTRGIFNSLRVTPPTGTWKGPQNAAEQGLESAHTSMMQALLNSDAAANYAQEGDAAGAQAAAAKAQAAANDAAVSAMKAQAAANDAAVSAMAADGCGTGRCAECGESARGGASGSREGAACTEICR